MIDPYRSEDLDSDTEDTPPDVTVTRIGDVSFENETPPAAPVQPSRRFPVTVQSLAEQGFDVKEAPLIPSINPETGERIGGRAPPSVITVQKLLEQGYDLQNTMPTSEQYGAAATEAYRRALIEGGMSTAMIAGGMKAGTAIAPFTGPFAPFMPATGALIGLGTSLYGRSLLEEDFEARRPKEAELQPIYSGVRTATESLLSAPLAFAFPAASAQSGRFAQLIGQLGNFSRTNPHSYLAREALISAYSGIYGGTAVAALPPEQFPVGGPLAQFLAESAAGVLSPGKFIFDGFMVGQSGLDLKTERKVAELLQRVVATESEGGRGIRTANQIADELTAAIADLPIDPKTGRPIRLTPAQLIDYRPLTAFERLLAQRNAQFSGETKEMGERGLQIYASMLQALTESGNPDLVLKAIKAREIHLQNLFQMAFDQAAFVAAEKAQRLGRGGSRLNEQIADDLTADLNKVIRAAQDTSHALYKERTLAAFRLNKAGTRYIPIKVKASNLAETYLDLTAGLDPVSKGQRRGLVTDMRTLGFKDLRELGTSYRKNARTPEYVEYFNNNKTGPNPAMAGLEVPNLQADRLAKAAGEFREKARLAETQNDANSARIYHLLANAAIRDLETLDDPIFSEARSFSKVFHDVFTRTFAGKFDDVDGSGRLIIPAETLVRRTVAGGADAAYMRMREISDAARFSEKLVADSTAQDVVQAVYAQEARDIFERLRKTKAIDLNNPAQVSRAVFSVAERKAGASAVPLAEFIKRSGGIADVGGELAAQDITNRTLPGLVRRVENVGGRLIVPPEAGMDAVRQRVFEAGYFPQKQDYNEITDSEIIDALRQDLFVDRVWTGVVRDRLAPFIGNIESINELAAQGITRDMSAEDIAAQLLRADEQARAQGLPTFVPESTLDEFAKRRRPGVIDPSQIINSVLGSQQRLMRSLASETTELKDGRRLINLKKFDTFRERNRDLIEELGLAEEFSSIARAQQALEEVMDPASKANYTLRNQKIFADLIGADGKNEDPFGPVYDALRSNRPVGAIKDLLFEINSSTTATAAEKLQAREGLQSILMSYAFAKAKGFDTKTLPDGEVVSLFDPQAYRQALYDPLKGAGQKTFPTLMSLMVQEGLVTAEQAANMKKLLDASLQIEKRLRSGVVSGAENLPTVNMSAVEELALSQLSARFAGMITPGGPGALPFAANVRRVAQRVFKGMPSQQQMTMLLEVAKDPELTAQLLRKDLSNDEKRNLGRIVLGLLFSPTVAPGAVQRYVQAPTEEEREAERQELLQRRRDARGGTASEQLQTLDDVYNRLRGRPAPPAPATRGMPGMPSGAPPAGGPPAGGGAPPTTQSRMMLQQLFPFDPITGAAAVQAGMPPMVG
jgi:hypothetical protein